MTTHIVWLVFWLVCAVAAYLLVRHGHRLSIGSWTQIDRAYWAVICLAYGPITLFVVALIYLVIKVSSTKWARREARW
jgi:hypothetical protein